MKNRTSKHRKEKKLTIKDGFVLATREIRRLQCRYYGIKNWKGGRRKVRQVARFSDSISMLMSCPISRFLTAGGIFERAEKEMTAITFCRVLSGVFDRSSTSRLQYVSSGSTSGDAFKSRWKESWARMMTKRAGRETQNEICFLPVWLVQWGCNVGITESYEGYWSVW